MSDVTLPDLPSSGDRVVLVCSCEAEIVVPLMFFLPRHCGVRVIERGVTCQMRDHMAGWRLVARWHQDSGRRVFSDVLVD